MFDVDGALMVEVVESDGSSDAVPVPAGGGTVAVGSVAVTVDQTGEGSISWTVEAQRRCQLEDVTLWARVPISGSARWHRQGWQSWSPTGPVEWGRSDDPARAGAPSLARAIYDGAARVPPPGELRSWGIGVIEADGRAQWWSVSSATHHDTVARSRPDGDVARVGADAWLGGTTLEPGQHRALHDLRWGAAPDADTALESWADAVAVEMGARRDAPFLSGWCSWYQWFERFDEPALRATLARAADDGWAFDVIQVDDGWQAAVGDWSTTSPAFESDLAGLADAIADAGFRPGLWWAPFHVSSRSQLAVERPEWLVADERGHPRLGNVNPAWGERVWLLDVTRDDVLEHLRSTAAVLARAGWSYQKLDFCFGAALGGVHARPDTTPAERVRAGLSAIRDGAGPSTYLLGCGAPLMASVGLVDAMRIGPDVAPSWKPAPDTMVIDGYEHAAPALGHAAAAVADRRHLHRRWWSNDPDCVLLRRSNTHLSVDQIDAWARVATTGSGLAMLSDDLALLDESDRRRWAELVEQARCNDRLGG